MHSFLITSFGFSSFFLPSASASLSLSLSLYATLSPTNSSPNSPTPSPPLDQNPDVNIVVLSGVDAHFCTCIDLTTLGSISDKSLSRTDRGRAEEKLQQEIKFL